MEAQRRFPGDLKPPSLKPATQESARARRGPSYRGRSSGEGQIARTFQGFARPVRAGATIELGPVLLHLGIILPCSTHPVSHQTRSDQASRRLVSLHTCLAAAKKTEAAKPPPHPSLLIGEPEAVQIALARWCIGHDWPLCTAIFNRDAFQTSNAPVAVVADRRGSGQRRRVRIWWG